MNHSTGRPTKAQQARLDFISMMRCVCCEMDGVAQPSPTEVDHLVDKGYRKHSGGHDATIPLCGWHHRGLCLNGWTAERMRAHFGPSFALTKRLATVFYGAKRELLETVDAVLRKSAA